MRSNQDFLLYPLATADLPVCPVCGRPLAILVMRRIEARDMA